MKSDLSKVKCTKLLNLDISQNKLNVQMNSAMSPNSALRTQVLSTSFPFCWFSVVGKPMQQWSREEVAAFLWELEIGEHSDQFRRTDGRLLLTLTKEDLRLRFGGDYEACDILWDAVRPFKAAGEVRCVTYGDPSRTSLPKSQKRVILTHSTPPSLGEKLECPSSYLPAFCCPCLRTNRQGG